MEDGNSKIKKVGNLLVELGKAGVNILADYAISYSNKSDARIDALEKNNTLSKIQKETASRIKKENNQRRNKAKKVKKIYKK